MPIHVKYHETAMVAKLQTSFDKKLMLANYNLQQRTNYITFEMYYYYYYYYYCLLRH